MAAFSNTLQHQTAIPKARFEYGSNTVIAGVDGQDFTVATKMKKVFFGIGIMDTDGMAAVVVPGIVSNGQITFSRRGSIETSADTISYVILGI